MPAPSACRCATIGTAAESARRCCAAAVDLADNWLNYTRLELTVYTDNAAALALYRKFGFEIEGTLKAYAFRDGRFIDAYTMARLRERSVPGARPARSARRAARRRRHAGRPHEDVALMTGFRDPCGTSYLRCKLFVEVN